MPGSASHPSHPVRLMTPTGDKCPLLPCLKPGQLSCPFLPLHLKKKIELFSLQHKHMIIIVHQNCFSRCAHAFLFLDCPPPLFCIPSPNLLQHLCWVHAQASDKALCVPSLGNQPCFSLWLRSLPSWKPHNCLPISPTV